MMAKAIASVREHLSTLEALAAAETRDPALYKAEQAAYRGLLLDLARHHAQQRHMTLPLPKENGHV